MSSLILNGNRFYVDFCSSKRTPRRKRVALRVRNRRDAERLQRQLDYEFATGHFDPWAARTEPEALDPEPPPAGPPASMPDVVEAFYASRAHRAAATTRTYRDIVGRFAASLPQDALVASLTAADVERWLDSTPAADVARRTYTKHLSTFFRWCVAEGTCPSDPTPDVRLRRVPRRFPKALTEAEVERLLATLESGGEAVRWLHDVVRFTVHAGLRRGEVVALRWRAVDLDTGIVTVECADGFQTKGGAERRLPLSGVPVDALRARAEMLGDRLRPDGSVFSYRAGAGPMERQRPMNGDYLSQRYCIWARVAGIRAESGPGAGFHGLRHTAITRLIERGVPVPVVQRFAGHSDIATTMRYCSVADDVYADRIRTALN